MKKLKFKEYIDLAKIKYDNSITISYYGGDILHELVFYFVRDLKITKNFINIDNVTIKFKKIKDMDIKITGTIEKVIIEDGKNTIDFESSRISNLDSENLSCGDLVVGSLKVGNDVSCSDIKADTITTDNGNISCGDIESRTLNTADLTCGDIQSHDITMNGNGSTLSCGDISGNITSSDVVIKCGDIGGDVNIKESGDVSAADIGGNLTANVGHVSCGDVYGDMNTNN